MWRLFTLMDIDANEEQAKILSVPYHNLTEKMVSFSFYIDYRIYLNKRHPRDLDLSETKNKLINKRLAGR